MRARVKRIFANVKAAGLNVDAIVLMMGIEPHLDMSFFYATGLTGGGLFERGALVLWPDGRSEMLSSPLEETSARQAKDTEIVLFSTNDERKAFFESRLGSVGRIGINAPELTVADYLYLQKLAPKAELVDVQKPILDTRLVKDETELKHMQRAATIGSRVADAIPKMLKPGMREFELAAEMSYAMQNAGASGPSFQSIVSFGKTSAEPHYSPGNVKLAKGQFVLCDFGAYVNRYASDITRTWVYGKGKPDHRDIYETVLAAQEAALDMIRPGAKGGDVHKAAASVIDATKWKGKFIHGVGHSLGLAVHDGGSLHPRMDLTLEPGMVVTVEPGIYVPGFGGVRIEDDVVVTNTSKGWKSLTNAKKAYREI
ncbi:MAG: M24 family metallopeptidase [Thermoplasmatota archaeon]